MNKKKIICLVFGSILSILLSMLIVCFVEWEWNIAKMGEEERLVMVIISVSGLVLTGIIVENTDSWKEKD